MPASSAISSQGTMFFRWDESEWVEVAEIVGIDGPGKSRETIDVTTLRSSDGYREHIGDLKDGGTVSLTMNFTSATYALFEEDFESDTPQNYAIVLPDTEQTSVEFEGLVTELPLSAQVGDRITANITIKVTGKPVVSTGSSGGVGAVS